MPPHTPELDVVVIGAGPAGAAAAQLLAAWGHSVALVHRATPARLALAESLPPSIRKLLQLLGQLDAIDAAGFYPNHGTIVDWAGVSRKTTSPDVGYHVGRAPFDECLRGLAAAAGVLIINGSVQQVDDGDRYRVVCNTRRGTKTLRARFVCDCSGRAGVMARRALRVRRVSYQTLAVVAEWECPAWPADDRAFTTVESWANGWAWSVPLSTSRRQCTVMIDPPGRGDVTAAANSSASSASSAVHRSLTSLYDTELRNAAALADRLRGARRVTPPWTCDASVYDSASAVEGRTLLVGDAASFIEPLSSAGVRKALLSAWRAAVVINTCLTNPPMTEASLDLYARREREVYAGCVRRSARFFYDAAAAYGTPFWSIRAAAPVPVGDAAEDTDNRALADEADVRAAFDGLRGATRVRLRAAGTLRFEARAVIEGRHVVMRDAVIPPGGGPLQFAAGVELAPLARIADGGGDVPDIISTYHRQIGPAPIEGLLTGLSLLVARRALIPVVGDDGVPHGAGVAARSGLVAEESTP